MRRGTLAGSESWDLRMTRTISAKKNEMLRSLPSVTSLLNSPAIQIFPQSASQPLVVEAIKRVLNAERERILSDDDSKLLEENDLISKTKSEIERLSATSLKRVINATGIVLHTGLGRARLAKTAVEAVRDAAESHSLLEIDQESGKRGSRREHVRELLLELTGAEDATVVNNCAGAVFLAVTALAAGREVIISRGELVEIGGAFRMPDIIKASGATLVEVGTTNRTRISDYAEAVTDRTGLILRCSPSNFAIIGFTEETPTEDLAALGRSLGVPVMDDQGSGSILPPALLGLPESKGSLRESVSAGSDVIAASGDKLLGGPQVGLLLGSEKAISRINSHPLARALRADKLTLAALEATLRLYRDPERALREIPTLRYLRRSYAELRALAETLKLRIEALLPKDRFELKLIEGASEVGGGSLPGELLPTVCVALQSRTGSPAPDEIAKALRKNDPPIFARIKADRILFDPRTLEQAEIEEIAIAISKL